LLVRVIAPAHRDDDDAVSVRLRSVRPSGPRPRRAAAGKIAAGQPAQVFADNAQHRGVLLAGPQPGLHPRAGGRGDHNGAMIERMIES
jgi:hypothetical protein